MVIVHSYVSLPEGSGRAKEQEMYSVNEEPMKLRIVRKSLLSMKSQQREHRLQIWRANLRCFLLREYPQVHLGCTEGGNGDPIATDPDFTDHPSGEQRDQSPINQTW